MLIKIIMKTKILTTLAAASLTMLCSVAMADEGSIGPSGSFGNGTQPTTKPEPGSALNPIPDNTNNPTYQDNMTNSTSVNGTRSSGAQNGNSMNGNEYPSEHSITNNPSTTPGQNAGKTPDGQNNPPNNDTTLPPNGPSSDAGNPNDPPNH
jgi:hypothetical protein